MTQQMNLLGEAGHDCPNPKCLALSTVFFGYKGRWHMGKCRACGFVVWRGEYGPNP